MHKYWLLILVTALISCDKEKKISDQQNAPNILLIITDDMGKDATNGFI